MTDATGSIVFQCLDYVARDEYILEETENGPTIGYDDNSSGSYEPQKKQYYNPKQPSPDDEKKGFQILLFGSNHEGRSITVEITGFRPYFYVQIPETWSTMQKSAYEKYLRSFVH